MKVSLNWARFYGSVDITSISTEELIQKVGEQLGAVENVVHWGPRYDGIVVAKVVRCDKHPNADKLRVCHIDDGGVVQDVQRGEDGLVQVVCGAANVAEGMFAAWIPPGVTVPSTVESDPLTLESRELRGVVSNGMLASAAELAISDDHSELLEINPDEVGEQRTKPGTAFKQLYGLDDIVIDLENKMFTHRPDCFGILGVVRELAGITHQRFVSPEWYKNTPQFTDKEGLKLSVRNQDFDTTPRFMAVTMDNIRINKSPVWVQAALTRVGIKPINNVVDITNFAMHLTGQPLHAFDYDKVMALSDQPTLGPRLAKAGETLQLLGGKKINLHPDDIIIATDKQPVALAGIMGGADTEVDEHTKRIIIECATFDMYAVRRSSMRHGLFTDAAQRFTKGQSPHQNDRVLAYTIKLMSDTIGANQSGKVEDLQAPTVHAAPTLAVRASANFINQRLGTDLEPAAIERLLSNVEFVVETEQEEFVVQVPFWRRDIAIAEDLVEEVGRLHGYGELDTRLPKRTVNAAVRSGLIEMKQLLRQLLSACGANEVLTYNFVHGDSMRKLGLDTDRAFQLRNALSPQLQYIRTNLLPSIASLVHPNIKAGFDRFVLFEMNPEFSKSSLDQDGLPIEYQRLALVYAAHKKYASTRSAYYQAKHYLDTVLSRLYIQAQYTPLHTLNIGDNTASQLSYIYPLFQPDRSAVVTIDGTPLGIVGEPSIRVSAALKLPKSTAMFDIDIGLLQEKFANQHYYNPLPRFPSITRDVTLRVAEDTTYSELLGAVTDSLKDQQSSTKIRYRVIPLDIFKKQTGFKHMTFRITINHPGMTLTDELANKVVDGIGIAAAEKCNASII